MDHKSNCMCDACIRNRVRRIAAEAREAEEQRKIEEQSQAYIRRRGGIDPRSPGKKP